MNTKIPDFFKEYFKHFGFNENAFWSIFNEEDDFLEQNELIQELGHSNFIAIGDEYAENLIVANIENQQLYLLEDDLLIDLKTTFEQMLHEAISTFDLPDFDALQNIETAFKVLLKSKTEITTALIDSLNALINEAEQNDDSLFSTIISAVPNNNYVVYGGNFNDFKTNVDSESIDYDYLWSINSAKYQQSINLNQTPSKAMDLLLLEILKNLKNEGYFDQQIENFSISVQSNDVNFFTEDTFDEA